ncbi:MAG TPA: hypothetical protein VGO34_14810 [Alphaproteobacteria bacterium]|jgi:hypothetical protein
MTEEQESNVVDFAGALKEFNRAKKMVIRANKRMFAAARLLSMTATPFDAKGDELVAAAGDVADRSAKLLDDAAHALAESKREQAEAPTADEQLGDEANAVLRALISLAEQGVCTARNRDISSKAGLGFADDQAGPRDCALADIYRRLERAGHIRREDKNSKRRRILIPSQMTTAGASDEVRLAGPSSVGENVAAATAAPVARLLADPDYSAAKDGPNPMLPVVQWLRDRGDRIAWNAVAGAYSLDGTTKLQSPRSLLSYANCLRAADGMKDFPKDMLKASGAAAA